MEAVLKPIDYYVAFSPHGLLLLNLYLVFFISLSYIVKETKKGCLTKNLSYSNSEVLI